MAVAIPGVVYHVGVVTRDLDEGMAAIGAQFGLEWADVVDGATVPQLHSPTGPVPNGLRRVTLSMGGPLRVELLEGEAGSVWHTTEVSRLHHIAYWVDNVESCIALLTNDGWEVEITVLDAGGRPSMFAYMTKPGNARIELTDSSRRAETLERIGYRDFAPFLM